MSLAKIHWIRLIKSWLKLIFKGAPKIEKDSWHLKTIVYCIYCCPIGSNCVFYDLSLGRHDKGPSISHLCIQSQLLKDHQAVKENCKRAAFHHFTRAQCSEGSFFTGSSSSCALWEMALSMQSPHTDLGSRTFHLEV